MSVFTNKGYNPITKENEDITEWLKYKDNLVFIIDGNKTPLCLERSLFNLNTIQMNYILHLCDINDNIYVKPAIKNDTSFIDLGKYNLIEDTVINYENFNETISKNQIFLIKKDSAPPITLFNEETIMNINIFNKTLMEYSKNVLYRDITGHLLHGKKATKAVIQHISNMDKCFMEYAQITKNDDMIVFRGMKGPYPLVIGESMIIPNYLSTTTSTNPAILNVFQNYNYYGEKQNKDLKPEIMPSDINNCCIYEIKIDKGIPYIDMKFSTVNKPESEILLPRNLLITYTGEYISTSPKRHVRRLTIGKSTEEQFESINKKQCTEFNQANISPVDVIFTDESVAKSIKSLSRTLVKNPKKSSRTTVKKTRKVPTSSKKTVKSSRMTVKK